MKESLKIVLFLLLAFIIIKLREKYDNRTWRSGVLFNKNGWWIGVHYSPYNRRFCINFLPCITWWITIKGGSVPRRQFSKKDGSYGDIYP